MNPFVAAPGPEPGGVGEAKGIEAGILRVTSGTKPVVDSGTKLPVTVKSEKVNSAFTLVEKDNSVFKLLEKVDSGFEVLVEVDSWTECCVVVIAPTVGTTYREGVGGEWVGLGVTESIVIETWWEFNMEYIVGVAISVIRGSTSSSDTGAVMVRVASTVTKSCDVM